MENERTERTGAPGVLASCLSIIDRFVGLPPDDTDPFHAFRARALIIFAPAMGLLAIVMGGVQAWGEWTRQSTSFGGLAGLLSIAVPLGLGVILCMVPFILRRTKALRIGAWLTLVCISIGLMPWPFLLFGIYSRNIIMLTVLPVLFSLLISPRVGFFVLISVCGGFAALPVLSSLGRVHMPEGITIFDAQGHAIAAIMTCVSIYILLSTVANLYRTSMTTIMAARREAVDLSEQDQLTCLANRRVYQRYLTQCMHSGMNSDRGQGTCKPEGGSACISSALTLVLIDLDRFKEVNDSHGHYAGDILLQTIARRLQGIADEWESALTARLGGDEFALVVCDNLTSDQLASLGERIVTAMRAPVRLDHGTIYPTVSVGIACAPDDAKDAKDLQWLADIALYASKSAGRDQWHRATNDLKAALEERQSLIRAMRQPEFPGQLEVWYQPQVCARTGRVAGLEALTRWRHPELGLLMPNRFIKHAEENGLIGVLSDRVLKTAIAGAAPWIKAGLVDTLAVNISGQDLKDADIVATIRNSIETHGLPPSAIEVEVTESFFLWDLDGTFTVLQALGQLGVRIALDDFGTGYSSLAYLRSLPINTIKIDKSFVFDCDTNANSLAIVQAIIGLAGTLSMATVAEGIETEAHRTVLDQLGTDRMQGYLFSAPMPHQDCATFLTTWQAKGAA